MIKQTTVVHDSRLSSERKFCQRIQYRVGYHFHSPKNPRAEYQMSNSRLELSFVFDMKPSKHDTSVIYRLTEEEFHLHKRSMKTVGWSEKFTLEGKKEKVNLVFTKNKELVLLL